MTYRFSDEFDQNYRQLIRDLRDSSLNGSFMVSGKEGILEASFSHGIDPSFESVVSMGGTVDWNSQGYANLTASNSGDRAAIQSRYFRAGPGGQRTTYFAIKPSIASNFRARFGVFDEVESGGTGDGHFVMWENGSLFVVERSGNVDTATPSSSFNEDKLDGTGPSRINLDAGNFFVGVIEETHVGTTRFGILVNGSVYFSHYISGVDNPDSGPSVAGNLPIRLEVESTGGAGSMRVFSVSSSREAWGATTPSQLSRSILSDTTKIVVPAETSLPLCSVRLRADHKRSELVPISACVRVLGSQNIIQWSLVKNAELVDASWTSVTTRAEKDCLATSFSGGDVIQTHCGVGEMNIDPTSTLSSDAEGNVDVLTLVCSNPNADPVQVIYSVNWRE